MSFKVRGFALIGLLPLGLAPRREFWSDGKDMKFFLCVLGLVMIVEGLPYFAFPEKMKIWIEKIVTTPESSLRRFGFVLMALGMCLIYFGRN